MAGANVTGTFSLPSGGISAPSVVVENASLPAVCSTVISKAMPPPFFTVKGAVSEGCFERLTFEFSPLGSSRLLSGFPQSHSEPGCFLVWGHSLARNRQTMPPVPHEAPTFCPLLQPIALSS